MISYILLTYLMVKTDPKRHDEYSRSLERGGEGGRIYDPEVLCFSVVFFPVSRAFWCLIWCIVSCTSCRLLFCISCDSGGFAALGAYHWDTLVQLLQARRDFYHSPLVNGCGAVYLCNSSLFRIYLLIMATLMEELRVDPVVQEVIFSFLLRSEEASIVFFSFWRKMWTFSQVCAFFLFFIVVWKVLPLEGIWPHKKS